MDEYTDYSLEKMLAKLQRHFGATSSNIIVVRAERIIDTYSHFDYFLRPGMCILHIQALIDYTLKFYKQSKLMYKLAKIEFNFASLFHSP